MVQLVLFLAICNILLGYGLAVSLSERPFQGLTKWKECLLKWRLKLPRILPGQRVESPHDTEVIEPIPALEVEDAAPDLPLEVSEEPCQPPPPAVATVSELPLAWRESLAAEQLAPQWFADGLTQALRLQLGTYRQHILAAEARARLVLSQESAQAVEQLVADFRFLHHEWLRQLAEGAQLLHGCRGRLGPAAIPAGALETTLFDHLSRMEALDRHISEISFRTDMVLGCRRLMLELIDLADCVHQLRDELVASLARILNQQQMLGDGSSRSQLDPLTGWLNRIGLEAAAPDIFAAGSRERQAVLLALDHFRRVNERLGTRAGDRTLRAFAQLLADLIQRAGVSAEMVRLTGTRFLLVIDGMSRDQATSLGEQIRQSLEGVTFDCQGTKLDLTTRLGITTVEAGETLDALLWRLNDAVAAAENAGRNRCVVVEAGGGMRVVIPPVITVISRCVTIDDAAELTMTPPAGQARLPLPPVSETTVAAEQAPEISTSS